MPKKLQPGEFYRLNASKFTVTASVHSESIASPTYYLTQWRSVPSSSLNGVLVEVIDVKSINGIEVWIPTIQMYFFASRNEDLEDLHGV